MYSIDITSLLLGAVAGDGGVGTVLASPGDIVENTVKVNPADPTKTSFFAIGKQAAVYTALKAGETVLAFDIMTFDLEVIQDLLGGTITGVAPNEFWNAPIGTPPIIEKTIEILDVQGMTWQFGRVQISAKLVGEFNANTPNVIRVMGTILQPTKAGVSHTAYGKKA